MVYHNGKKHMRASTEGPESHPHKHGRPVIKLLVLAGLIGLALFLYQRFGASLNLASIAAGEAELRDYQAANPYRMLLFAFAIYVTVTGLSLPGALVITVLVGWVFGFWQGVLLVSFASTLGATFAFLVSRFLLRDLVQSKFSGRLKHFNEALGREGPFYLFTLRLIPVVPFVAINLVMGLTPIRTRTYWWISQVGMLPGTMAYVFAGSELPSLRQLADNGVKGLVSPGLIAAFVLLGLFPIAVKKLVARFKKNQPAIS